jgi:hypothetical protein
LTTISFEIADEDMQRVQEHLDAHGITLADFARQSMLNALNGELTVVASNLQALEGNIDHTMEWNKLGA